MSYASWENACFSYIIQGHILQCPLLMANISLKDQDLGVANSDSLNLSTIGNELNRKESRVAYIPKYYFLQPSEGTRSALSLRYLQTNETHTTYAYTT